MRIVVVPVREEINDAVGEVIHLLREHMRMSVVFVPHFTEGPPASPPPPFPAGTRLTTAVTIDGGRVYGTLCCVDAGSGDSVTERDVRQLRYAARLAARKLDEQQVIRELSRRALSEAPRPPRRQNFQ